MARASKTSSASRRESLRDGLPLTVELLKNRLACDIPVGYVEDYVALDWLEWHGGTLRLTATGQNVCRYATMQHKKSA